MRGREEGGEGSLSLSLSLSRIPWPVDMRGWEKVGYYVGLELWAKDDRRRLIDAETREVTREYPVGCSPDESGRT